MLSRHAMRPDLGDCALEDRCLLYAPGLYSSGFAQITSQNTIVSPGGTSTTVSSSGGGSASYPGPSFFYLLVGGGGNGGSLSQGTGSAGISLYGSSTNNGFVLVSLGGAGGSAAVGASSGPNGNQSASNSGVSATVGYGGSVSSGYGTSLNSANSYGTSADARNSVPVHTYDDSADVTPVADNPISGANDKLWGSMQKKTTTGRATPSLSQ